MEKEKSREKGEEMKRREEKKKREKGRKVKANNIKYHCRVINTRKLTRVAYTSK